jgi:hypothetical protein
MVDKMKVQERGGELILEIEVVDARRQATEEQMKREYPHLFFDRETRPDRIGVADFISKICKKGK